MNIVVTFFIAISLSMDAFSLALSLGMRGLKPKDIWFLSLTVGLFHFLMPFIGTILGHIFYYGVHADANMLAGVIFLYIAYQMYKEYKTGEDVDFKMGIVGSVLFAVGVSLDSFGVGFALRLTGMNIVRSFSVFSLMSFSFTYLGLRLGKVFNIVLGNYSILLGSIIMCILSLLNFCHFLF